MKKPFAIACLVSAMVSGPLFAATDLLLREHCRKDECTLMRIINLRTVGKNDGGRMMEVKSRSVVVPEAKAGEPEKIPEPNSFGLVRVSYAYCSTKKPAVVFYDDGKFHARVLNVGEASAGWQGDSQIEYWAACHNRVVSIADVTEGKLAKDAADLGYTALPENLRKRRDFRTKKKAFRFFGL